MTKKLNKEELIQAILACKSNTYKHTNLRDKKNVELEQILFELQDKDLQLVDTIETEPVVEIAKEEIAKVEKAEPIAEPVVEPVVVPPKAVAKAVPVKTTAYVNNVTLQIAKPFYYHTRNKVGKVRVTNLGGGDAYVGSEKVTHGDKDARIVSGAVREYENVKILACFATSQPRLKIEEI